MTVRLKEDPLHGESDAAFAKMPRRLTEVADIFAAEKIEVGLETGQETAPALAGLQQKLNRPNVGVNFDTANIKRKQVSIFTTHFLPAFRRRRYVKYPLARGRVSGIFGAMFEKIKDQLPRAAEKVAHLRRFL